VYFEDLFLCRIAEIPLLVERCQIFGCNRIRKKKPLVLETVACPMCTQSNLEPVQLDLSFLQLLLCKRSCANPMAHFQCRFNQSIQYHVSYKDIEWDTMGLVLSNQISKVLFTICPISRKEDSKSIARRKWNLPSNLGEIGKSCCKE
jgi:hypothetical protein